MVQREKTELVVEAFGIPVLTLTRIPFQHTESEWHYELPPIVLPCRLAIHIQPQLFVKL